MQAAVYRGKRKVGVESLDIPQLKKGEVLIRVDSWGVCATNLKKVE